MVGCQVVSDGGAEVRELMDRIKLIIIDGDGWWCFGTLYKDIAIFQADGQPVNPTIQSKTRN